MINIMEGQLYKKYWEYKMEQRKKRTKLPLIKNNPQGQPTSREPRMIEIG
jgi:hypothetical protein